MAKLEDNARIIPNFCLNCGKPHQTSSDFCRMKCYDDYWTVILGDKVEEHAETLKQQREEENDGCKTHRR